MSQSTLFTAPVSLPLLPLRDVVVFPHMVIPLFVGRPRSIRALEKAMEAGKHIMLVAQKLASNDDPNFDRHFIALENKLWQNISSVMVNCIYPRGPWLLLHPDRNLPTIRVGCLPNNLLNQSRAFLKTDNRLDIRQPLFCFANFAS